MHQVLPASAGLWHGFERHVISSSDRMGVLIAPRQPLPNRLWAWKGEFLDAFPGTEIQLLERGVYVAYLSAPNLLGSPAAVRYWSEHYDLLTGKFGMAARPALIGLSRGGLYCYNWAIQNPEKVCCIYGDAPVCDLKSWPGGKGSGEGSIENWNLAMELYGFKSEAEALAFTGNPVDNLQSLAAAQIPLLHVYGDADEVVPWQENTGVLANRYRALGGEIELIPKPGVGHHPHGLDDPTPVTDFILKYSQQANASSKGQH